MIDGVRTVLLLPLRNLHPVMCFRHVEHIANERKTARAWGEGEARGVHPTVVLGTGVEEGNVAKDGGRNEHVQKVELAEGQIQWDVECLRIHGECFLDSAMDGFLNE